jgi:RES domain-containing protein
VRHAYRIVKRRYAKQAFNGEGARLAGGRWNSPGQRAVYLSGTLSLAAMETFVHLGEDAARIAYVYFEVAIPDTVAITTLTRSPKGWRNEPPDNASMNAGDQWIKAGKTALLKIPSALIPSETNLILNPLHADCGKLRNGVAQAFHFDPRMWK